MEQLRLAATATRICRFLSLAQNQARQRGYAAVSSGRVADPDVFSKERDQELKPAVPSGDPEEMRDHYEPDTSKRGTDRQAETVYRTSKETEPLAPSKLPLASSSSRLESVGVNNPAEPFIQRKRENSQTATLEEINCAGLDGTPFPAAKEKQGKQEEEDDNEYYRSHKASPLSEIKMADTRKPITRATDGTADSGSGGDVIGWRPEQLDTAEEALARASRIWRENAMRGDPNSPHGRILRELRGEWF